MQGGVDVDFSGDMLARPQVDGKRVAAELKAFAFVGSGGGEQGSGRVCALRPAWIQQLRVEEPLDLPVWCGGVRGEHLEKPLLPLHPDPLELPEPLLQQRDGREGHPSFVALQPHRIVADDGGFCFRLLVCWVSGVWCFSGHMCIYKQQSFVWVQLVI